MVLLYYLRHFLKPEIYGAGWSGMIKQGFYEAPLLTLACVLCPYPFFFIPYIFYRYDKLDGGKRRYCYMYTVMRPGDPRLEFFNGAIDRTKHSQK